MANVQTGVFVAAWRICGSQHSRHYDNYTEAKEKADEKGGVILKQVLDPHSNYAYSVLV